MGASVTLSHADIDPNSIQIPSFGHEDIDPNSIEPIQSKGEPGLLSQAGSMALDAGKYALGKIGEAGRFIDKYTGAPIRAGIGAAQEGNNPFEAANNQFGQDASKAPTGKDIVIKAGVGDKTHLSDIIPAAYTDRTKDSSFWDPRVQKGGLLDPTAADAAGVAVNVASDPLTYIPGGAIAKGAEAIGDTKYGAKAAGLLGKTGIKVGNALTGVPEKEIETYAKYAPEVKAMSRSSANDVGEAANQISEKMMGDIQATKQSLNNQIGQTLAKMPTEQNINAQPILDAIDSQKSRINSKLNPEKLDEIDAIKAKVGRVVNENGMMSIQDLNDVKKDLMETAKGAYAKNGQIFQVGRDSQQAAKAGAGRARKILNAAAPDIADANNQLSKLHTIESSMNRNLLVEDKSTPGLIGAGTGGNPRNIKTLQRIGQITGTEPLADSEKLAAMRTFGSPQILPVGTTGKVVGHGGLGLLAGHAIGGVPGMIVGGAMTSPQTLKTAIDASRFAGENAKYAEPAGLALDQLGHVGQPSGVAPIAVPKGFIYQAQQRKKDENRKPNSR